MITKAEDTTLTQKCVCGHLRTLSYSSLSIAGEFIHLPVCSECNKSIEILFNNNVDNPHSILVSKVFAKVATQG